MLSSASSSSSSGRRPYYTGKQYNPDGTRRKKHGAPGIGTWCLAVLLGCIIVIVLKRAATTTRRRFYEGTIRTCGGNTPDLSRKTPCRSCTRFHPHAQIGKKQWIVSGKHGDGYAHMAMATVLANGTVLVLFQASKEGEGNRTNTSRSHTEREKRRIRLVLVKSRERRPPKEGVPGRAS